MSILIEGMEMPKGCAFCRIRKRNGKKMVCQLCDEEWDIHDPMSADRRLDNCPLRPVPPHGRLIDADALKSDGFYMLVCHTGKMPYEYAAMRIDDAPTIIPAEPCNNLSKPCKEDEP